MNVNVSQTLNHLPLCHKPSRPSPPRHHHVTM